MGRRDPPRREPIKQERRTIPLAAEHLSVERRRVERGLVQLVKTVRTDETTVVQPVTHREIHIERVPMDRFVDQPEGVRREQDTLIIPVYEEVPVVVMKTKLKEEVRVTTKQWEQTRHIPVTLRTEEVAVRRVPPHDPAEHKERRQR